MSLESTYIFNFSGIQTVKKTLGYTTINLKIVLDYRMCLIEMA